MNQLSRGQNPVGIPIDEITHVGQTVSNWDFETQTSIESPDDVQGAIRVYHTPREGDNTGGFHFCVVRVVEFTGPRDEAVDCVFSDQNTRATALATGTANEERIRRMPPTMSRQSFQGLPVATFNEVCEILEDLKEEYCH